MIKSLMITHGNFGTELINVTEKILEKKVDIESINFDWVEDGSKILDKIENFIQKNKQHSIIIFTDMFGGSPSNICFKFIKPNVEVITGINLPGLLKFLTHKEKSIDFRELVASIKNGAIDGINIMGEYLGEKKNGRRKS
jgi:PTS system mannose-specific IIA component